jgi:hypothetical protein
LVKVKLRAARIPRGRRRRGGVWEGVVVGGDKRSKRRRGKGERQEYDLETQGEDRRMRGRRIVSWEGEH